MLHVLTKHYDMNFSKDYNRKVVYKFARFLFIHIVDLKNIIIIVPIIIYITYVPRNIVIICSSISFKGLLLLNNSVYMFYIIFLFTDACVIINNTYSSTCINSYLHSKDNGDKYNS